MRKLLSWISPITLAALLLLLLMRPDAALAGAKNGLLLWAVNVLPSLLPYFILSQLFIESGVVNRIGRWTGGLSRLLFRLPADGLPGIVLSWISGSPSGARIAGQLSTQGILTQDQARRFCAASALTGPLFLVGAVGSGMLGDARAGIAALLACMAGALANGLLWRAYGSHSKPGPLSSAPLSPTRPLMRALPVAIGESATAVLSIGAAITLFSVILALLQETGLLTALSSPLGRIVGEDVSFALLTGIIELTNGCAQTAALPLALEQKTAIIAGLAGFGGLSVAAQASVFLQGIMPVGQYLAQRATQGLLSYLAAALLAPWLLPGIPALASAGKNAFCPLCIAIFVLAVVIAYIILRLLFPSSKGPQPRPPHCPPPNASCANPGGSCARPPSYPVRVSPSRQTNPPRK